MGISAFDVIYQSIFKLFELDLYYTTRTYYLYYKKQLDRLATRRR